MLLKTKVTSFDLGSVPKVFKKGWQEEHIVGLTLESIQASARSYKWFWWFSVVGSVALIVCIHASLGWPPQLRRFTIEWWGITLLDGLVMSLIWWITVLHFLTPFKFALMQEFVGDYEKLMQLLNQEWKYQFEYPTGGPGVMPTFENIEPFVREKLIKLANQIKALENPKADWSGCLGGSPDPKQLREEFGRAFDILKPFGLVYPSYDPYFDPEGSYFYG
jgi:hypothetical protein